MNKYIQKFKKININFLTYTSFSVRKKTFFAKRLSFLIRSGVPMLESIHVLKSQAKASNELKIFEHVAHDISNGQTLAGSLAKFKNAFGDFTINVIKAGEASGTLMHNLEYLAEELKKRSMLRKKITSALIYPFIILIATFGIVGFLTIYIFPKIMPIFQSMSMELPFTTKAVMFVSNLLRHHGIIILFVLILGIITISLLNKFVPQFRYFNDGLLLKLPIFGSIIKNYNLANVMRTMGILLKSGMSLSGALQITAETTANVRYTDAFLRVSKGVLKGKPTSELIASFADLFPHMLIHMISIGEKSGNLSNTFTYLSEYYEHEFDEKTKNLSSTIEPVLMVVMGFMVGFVAISVITPIYEFTSNLNR